MHGRRSAVGSRDDSGRGVHTRRLAEFDESAERYAGYGHVVDGRFDDAYALWSARMKATYPRQENLDGRFANTAAIRFSNLFTASQTATTATVQANFTETYDSGASRSFVGYWRLVRVDGRWLLDEPTY